MNLHKMIGELQAEKQRLDEAILALERLSAGKPKRRAKSSGGSGRREEEEEAADSEADSRYSKN